MSAPETVTARHVVHLVERVVKDIGGETIVARARCGQDVAGLPGHYCPACQEAPTGGPERR